LNPLTHHEILELVAPFARRGRHVDLAATDRLQRRVVFKPLKHPARQHPAHQPESGDSLQLRETLTLEDLGSGAHRLTRILSPDTGPDARLEAEGLDPGELLARIQDVPLQRQFQHTAGVTIALSFRLTSGAMTLTCGMAQVAGVTVKLDASIPRGPAAISFATAPGEALELPQDALAVLGGRWSRLRRSGEGWAAELQLSRREPRRSRDAEAAIDSAVMHIARVLEEPPHRFHERWVVARWRVFVRRIVPLAACVALIVCAAAVPKLHLAESSGLRMLILNSPPILMILFFCLREVPIVEIPPVPRRSTAASWHERPVPPTSHAR
jgi:hypothetical protein